jgi:hypothetical protein
MRDEELLFLKMFPRNYACDSEESFRAKVSFLGETLLRFPHDDASPCRAQ